MSICLVQSKTNSSQLKNLLQKLGYGPIHITHSPIETSDLAIIDRDFSESSPTSDSQPPFLAIGSDSQNSPFFLRKPFGRRLLEKAIHRALIEHQKHRKVIYALTSSFDWLNSMAQAHWKGVRTVSDIQVLQDLISAAPHVCGAILVDPLCYGNHKWLGNFKKTRKGTQTLVCCLSRDPLLNKTLRTHCQIFFEPSSKLERWDHLFKTMAIRNIYQINFKSQRERVSKQKGLFCSETREVKGLLKRDPLNPFLVDWLGSLFWKRGQYHVALGQWLHSIDINPFRSHPYIQLIRTYQKKHLSFLLPVIQQASRFCKDDHKLMALCQTLKEN